MVFDVKNQNVSKVMAFVIIYEGKAQLFWHQDENGKNVSVNSDQYIKSVVDVLEDLDSRKLNSVYIWQQDGATCHTSRKSLAFFEDDF